MTSIRVYHNTGELPTSNLEAKKICVTNGPYVLIDKVLYQRGYLSLLLCYMDTEKGSYLRREIHEGICEHMMGVGPSPTRLYTKGTTSRP